MKVVVIGANRGIGFELASQWLQRGDDVVATYRDDAGRERLERLRDEFGGIEGAQDVPGKSPMVGELTLHRLDVRDDVSVDALAQGLHGQAVDVLVNSAGLMGGERQNVGRMDYADWANVLAVNTLGPFRVSTALLPHLRRSSRPRVVTLSSIMGCLHRKSVGYYAYRSSKAAVNKVMQLLAHELRHERIIACPVNPGWVRTDMGGEGAELTVTESALGILRLVDRLSLEDSGRLWQWDGTELAW